MRWRIWCVAYPGVRTFAATATEVTPLAGVFPVPEQLARLDLLEPTVDDLHLLDECSLHAQTEFLELVGQ